MLKYFCRFWRPASARSEIDFHAQGPHATRSVSTAITVTPCRSRGDFTRFETLGERLHGHVRVFVPPFPGSIVKHVSGKSPFSRRHGKIIPFLARRNGRVVGSIAAIINRSHNTYHNDTTGFFGFFECEDEPAVAHALLQRAATELASHGLTTIRGPYSPSVNDQCGLLIQGFDHRAYYGLPWNPPYYEKLILACGFGEVCFSRGFRLPLGGREVPRRYDRAGLRAAQKLRVRVRPIDMHDLWSDLSIVREVYNASLECNWGFVPIADEDLQAAASDLKMLADPGMILIAEFEGKRAGMILSLPNLNELLAIARHVPRFLRPLHVFLLLKVRPPTTGRQVAYGISPRYRDTSLHPFLTREHFIAANQRYSEAALGWIQENNTEVLRVADLLGAVPTWRWCIYEKPLDSFKA
jgi:hypothetical protein